MTITYIAGAVEDDVRLEVPGAAVPAAATKPRGRRRAPRGIRKLSGPLLILAIWGLITGLGWVSAQELSSPWAVAKAGWHLTVDGELWTNLSASLVRVVEGTVLGVVIGTILAVTA